MAEATLNDVIIRLREEGNLDRNSGTNSLKSLKQAVLQTDKTFKDGFGELVDFFKGNSLKDLEAKREQDEFNKDLLDALEGIKPKEEPKSKPDDTEKGVGLGLIGLGIAGALGGILGILQGQFKAIKTFGKIFSPDSLLKSLRGLRVGIAMQVELFKQGIVERLASVRAAISSGMTRLTSFFTIADDSNVGKTMARFKSALNALIEPFRVAISTLSDLFKGGNRVSGIFKTISGYMKSFGSTIAKVAGIVGKIFAPIAIVITAFETIQGAIDGFIEDGLIGGIEGAITGFFNSLIFGPLDLIKDAIAWVLDMFGFDKAATLLDSFSFAESFTAIIETLFYPFQWVQDKTVELSESILGWFNDKLQAVKNFFGFGGDELEEEADAASRDVRRAERALDTTRRAAAQGNITINGRAATEEETAELIRRREMAVKEAKNNYDAANGALEEFQNSTKLMDLLTETVTSITDWISSTFDMIIDGITNFDPMQALGDLGSMAADFFKGILRAVLPAPDALSFDIPKVETVLGDIGGGKINLNPIPSSIYEFAGLDPATGDLLAPSGGGSSAASGAELVAEGQANNQLASQGQGGGGMVVGGSTNVNQTTNNQTTVEPIPSTGRRPDALDDAYYMPAGA